MANAWNELEQLNKKYLENRDARVKGTTEYNNNYAKKRNEYDAKIIEENKRHEEKLRELNTEKAAALKKVTRESNYFDNIEREEKSKLELLKFAQNLVKEHYISNQDMCNILSKFTGKKWQMLCVSGQKVYDANNGYLDRVGLVCLNENDPQYGRKVYISKANSMVLTPTTQTCKVLLEGSTENLNVVNDELNNINWSAVLIDYMSNVTDLQKTYNGIQLAPTDMKHFKEVILGSLKKSLGMEDNSKTKSN